ncbi:metallophosphoesterase family protein [Hansschlegelia quercus]|uniref:Metallophosphoesterase n=1 Tax=Hansschlegelia quercus TaxID=2528245 RepID=A0A4Q9GJU9_9HYPH|nr:metallophosphoesterase [Hansschlegelia quercus]TBN53571.1 metallophosphoesterase [Hansschlegelia quercus]
MAEGPTTFRDHFLSIFQSAAADVASQIQSRKDGPPGAAPGLETADAINASAAQAAQRYLDRRNGGADGPPGGLGASLKSCADLGLRFLEAKLKNDHAALAAIEGEFRAGSCDPAWATTISEYAGYFGPDGQRGQIPYIAPSQAGEGVIEIRAGAKIALVADWGTGADPAIKILKQIAGLSPDIFIHLGDIYYSGTPKECAANFTQPLNAALGDDRAALPAYVLSGNHDMYCGGVGFYETIAALNPGPLKQSASYFCLRSSDGSWQLLAMDTGLHDYSPFSVSSAVTWLEKSEIEWLRRRVDEFEGRTILLSHHQLFSAFSPIGPADQTGARSATNPNLAAVLEQLNGDGKVAAWFWGHEHNLCVYEKFANLDRGRCIGHGAVPVFADEKIYEPVEGLDLVPKLVKETELRPGDTVWPHGFAFLELGTEGTPARVDYYQDIGGKPSLVHREEIS